LCLISNLLTKYIRLSNWILTSCQLHWVTYGWWILATIHKTWVKTMCTMLTYHSKLPLEMMMHTARVTKRVPAWERGGWEVSICSKYFISSSEYLQWERSPCYTFNVTLSPQRYWPEQHLFRRCPAEECSAFNTCVSNWSAFDTYVSNLSASNTYVLNLSAFDSYVSNPSALDTYVLNLSASNSYVSNLSAFCFFIDAGQTKRGSPFPLLLHSPTCDFFEPATVLGLSSFTSKFPNFSKT